MVYTFTFYGLMSWDPLLLGKKNILPATYIPCLIQFIVKILFYNGKHKIPKTNSGRCAFSVDSLFYKSFYKRLSLSLRV